MNRDENLTYEWLRNLRKKLLKEETPTTPSSGSTTTSQQPPPVAGQCPSNFPLAASKNSRYAQLYGDFCYNDLGGGKIAIQPPWEQNNITTISLNGQTYPINKYIAEHFPKVYDEAANVSGYRPPLSGIYNSRHVEGGGISAHAWGMAIDFDAERNPFIAGNHSVMEDNPKFIEVFEKNGFEWLGDGAGRVGGNHIGDDMHFYYSKPIGNVGPMFDNSTVAGDGASVESDWRKHFSSFLRGIGIQDNPLSSASLTEGASSSRKLNDEQIAKLCYDVGFRDENLVTAVRIVIGESGGNPDATNVNTQAKGKYKDSIDRGLFQFNNVAFPDFPDADAFDPIKSAQFAYKTFQKYGFKPWSGGPTKTHTYKLDGVTLDTNKIERAKNAVQKLTGYVSTGNFEYLSGIENNGQQSSDQVADWKSYMKKSLEKTLTEQDKLIDKKDKFKIKDKTKDHSLEKNKKVLLDMLSFYDKKLKFEKPVLIRFIDDEKNASKLLGKTAFYDPNGSSITIFTTNRLLKDILRSLGHELIHHKQHCKDEFHDVQTFEGYAQKDKKLRRKEKEAYLFGNILFRDWEDNYKSNHKETR